jgi:hypothetical protein
VNKKAFSPPSIALLAPSQYAHAGGIQVPIVRTDVQDASGFTLMRRKSRLQVMHDRSTRAQLLDHFGALQVVQVRHFRQAIAAATDHDDQAPRQMRGRIAVERLDHGSDRACRYPPGSLFKVPSVPRPSRPQALKQPGLDAHRAVE